MHTIIVILAEEEKKVQMLIKMTRKNNNKKGNASTRSRFPNATLFFGGFSTHNLTDSFFSVFLPVILNIGFICFGAFSWEKGEEEGGMEVI